MDKEAFDLALLVFRCAIGAVMIAHGWNHIWGGGKIEGTAGWFQSLGMKPGIFHAWLASLAELAGGAALVLGLLTPLGGAAVIGTMTVALVTNHRGNGFFIFRPGEGWEYVMTLVAAGFALAIVGPGGWSLDRVVGLWEVAPDWTVPGWAGFWIAVIAGVGGAAGLLAGFWRPEPAASDDGVDAGT